MKKTPFLFSAFLVLLIGSCSKNTSNVICNSTTVSDNQTIATWLNAQKTIYRKYSNWIDTIGNSMDLTNAKEIKIDEDSELLFYPLNLTLHQTNTNSLEINSSKNILMIVRNIKTKKIITGRLAILTTNKSSTIEEELNFIYTLYNPETTNANDFNGILSILKINKNLVVRTGYKNGNIVQKQVVLNGNTITAFGIGEALQQKKQNQDHSVPTRNDWYLVTYNIETQGVSNVSYLYKDSLDMGTKIASATTETLVRPDFITVIVGGGRICGFYPMIPVGNSYAGTINGLGIKLLGPYGETIDIEFGSACVSLTGNFTSPADASNAFIYCYNGAIPILINALDAGFVTPNPITAKNAFKNYITQRMPPSSTFSANGGCIGSKIPSSYARYC